MVTQVWEFCTIVVGRGRGGLVVVPVADPGFWSRGAKNNFEKISDVVKWSHANEMSFNRPGSRAHLRALEPLGFFFAEYAFSLFSKYLFVIFLKYLNTNLC